MGEIWIENCCGCVCPELIASSGDSVGIDHSIRPTLATPMDAYIYWGQDFEAGTYRVYYCGDGIFGSYGTGGSNVFYVTNAWVKWTGGAHPPDSDDGQNFFFRVVYQSAGVDAFAVFDDPCPPSITITWPIPPYTTETFPCYGYVQGDNAGHTTEAQAIAGAKAVALGLDYVEFEHSGGPIGIRAWIPDYGAGYAAPPPGNNGPTFALFAM